MADEAVHPVLTRRQFLVLSVGSLTAASIPVLVGCNPPLSPSVFPQPKEISSKDGVLDTSLLVKLKSFAGGGTPINVRMYGSPKAGVTNPNPDDDNDWDFALPGPTFRLNAGDTIHILLYNRLDGNDPAGVCEAEYYPTPPPTPQDSMPDCFHENNATNIHYHGLHVDQGLHADDVFITLYPEGQVNPPSGECNAVGQYEYRFQIPAGHPEGTFWYHPHKHGSSALQSANGLAGTLIVEDPLKDDPAFNGQLKDYMMVLQVIDDNLNFPGGGSKAAVSVNGVVTPEITLKVGEVQRWRIVNATWQDQTDFTVDFESGPGPRVAPPELYLIAMDGYFLPEDRWDQRQPAQFFYSAPGNRTDFLVKGIQEGSFLLRLHPLVAPRLPFGPPGSTPSPATPTPTPIPTTPFLKVTVGGKQDPPMDLPATLPALQFDQRSIPDSEIVGTKTLTFSIQSPTSIGGAPKGEAPKYLIAVDDQPGTQFDPNVVNECVTVDTAEEWTIVNETTLGHPFHIHLNPFFITDIQDPNDANLAYLQYNNPIGLWQDTIIIPAASTSGTPGKVTFKHRFPTLTGRFVLHCHILGHEDRGFMHVVQVRAEDEECSAGCSH